MRRDQLKNYMSPLMVMISLTRSTSCMRCNQTSFWIFKSFIEFNQLISFRLRNEFGCTTLEKTPQNRIVKNMFDHPVFYVQALTSTCLWCTHELIKPDIKCMNLKILSIELGSVDKREIVWCRHRPRRRLPWKMIHR